MACLILYHATPSENVASILKQGIKVGEAGMVYLSEKPNSWCREGDTVFAVRMDNVNHKLTQVEDNPDLDEVICWGPIPASALMVYPSNEEEKCDICKNAIWHDGIVSDCKKEPIYDPGVPKDHKCCNGKFEKK